jgi:PAS domain S-box-containing protein
MALVDMDGHWRQVNAALCAMLGYTAEELKRMTFQELTHPADLDADLDLVRRVVNREVPSYQLEKRYYHKQGSIVWALLSVAVLRDVAGRPLYFISQLQDVTARKQVEDALRTLNAELDQRVQERTAALHENEERLRAALAAGKLGTWRLDLTTGVLNSSPACKANFGLPPETAASRLVIFETIHPEDRARVRAAMDQAVADQTDYEAEYRTLWPDGSTHWILARGRGVYAQSGAPLYMVGVTADITARKQAEEALAQHVRDLAGINAELHQEITARQQAEQQSRERVEELETLLDILPVAVGIGHDPAATHITGNRASYELLRMPPGSNISASAPPAERQTRRYESS